MLALAVALCLSLALLVWSVLSPQGAALDARLFLAINQHRLPAPLELALRLTSHLGQLVSHLAIWGAVWLWADRRAGIVGGSGLACTWVACRLLKRATGRTRPYLAVEGARLVGRAPSLSSFPSSHAAHAIYSAAMLPHLLGWGIAPTAALWALAVLVCYSRIYIGAHYPRDVLAGVVIGLGGALSARATVRIARR